MAERNYDFTEIKTRIIIRNDSAENWAGSEVILEKGEPAIEYDAVNKTAKIKFGDGTSTFSELPFSTLTPTEINSVIGNISSSVSGMQFKGTVGTSGTVTDISSIQSPQNGDTYKIITGITLTSEQSLDGNEHELTVGDIIICSSDKWVFVPSGNEDITSIKIAGSGDTINVSTTAQTGDVVLGTAAGVNIATSVTNDTTTVPTTGAVKTYVDESISSVTDTKVTTITSSGDGNAVTDATIDNDGTTLTLNKNKKFLSYTGDELPNWLISSYTTTYTDGGHGGSYESNQHHLKIMNAIDIDDGEGHEYSSDVPSKVTFLTSPIIPSATEDNHPTTKSYVDEGRFVFRGCIGDGCNITNVNSLYRQTGPWSYNYDFNCGDVYLIVSDMTMNQAISSKNEITSLCAGDLIISYSYGKFTQIPLGIRKTYTKIALHSFNTPNNINVYEYDPDEENPGTDGLVILGTTAGKDATTVITDTDILIPTSNAVKTYVDDSVSSISTDSLIDGENILILNGGSATE